MVQQLPNWASQILANLEIDPVDIDITQLQEVADQIKHDPASDAVLTGFIAGYAAGLAQGQGMADFDRAHKASLGFIRNQLTQE